MTRSTADTHCPLPNNPPRRRASNTTTLECEFTGPPWSGDMTALRVVPCAVTGIGGGWLPPYTGRRNRATPVTAKDLV